MRTIFRLLILCMILSPGLTTIAQQAESVIGQVNKAMKAADAKNVALHFYSTIDLEVGDTDGNFSSDQAEVILQDFFSKNPVSSYTVKHKGSSDDGSKYIIGSYVSGNKDFRVYILLKQSEDGLKINQLQFEEE